MTPIKESIFILDVILNYILLLGLAFSILFPKKRIWPPPQKMLLAILGYMDILLWSFLLEYDTDTA